MAGQSIAHGTINGIVERLVHNPVNYRVGWGHRRARRASLSLGLGLRTLASWIAGAAAAAAGLIARGLVEYALHR